jgi:hypothetical protein
MPTTRAFLATAEAAIKLGKMGFIWFLPGFGGCFMPVLGTAARHSKPTRVCLERISVDRFNGYEANTQVSRARIIFHLVRLTALHRFRVFVSHPSHLRLALPVLVATSLGHTPCI